jgi:uncharacterized repeat protein (TIGR03803 family)
LRFNGWPDHVCNEEIMMTGTRKPQAAICRFVEVAALAALLGGPFLATPLALAQTYSVLYSFNGGADGATPDAALVLDASGNLYGTTAAGGSANFGTVFKLDPGGTKTVLYSFTGGADGKAPYAGLVLDPSGNLYGTTQLGGASNFGTAFKVDTAGTETVLHSFTGGADGRIPNAPLIRDSTGNVYGTTTTGGASGYGTVFKLNTAGTLTVLYSFAGGADGGFPLGGLVRDSAGNLYGTTNDGGLPNACFVGYFGCGVVFKVDMTGTETVLYTFTGGADGGESQAGLTLDAMGNLYGTTAAGGTGDSGVVFKIDRAGVETVLHTFGSGGVEPFGGVILDAAGNLYGTTNNGGSGYGSVFQLDATSHYTVLHQFTAGSDGANPVANLVSDTEGNLYGTTAAGGNGNFGTVFKLGAAAPNFSLATSALSPALVSPGGSSIATVGMTALSGFGGSIALSCSVQPSPAMAPTCSISPPSIMPGASATVTVTTTGVRASAWHPAVGTVTAYALCLPVVGMVAGMGFRSGRKRKGISAVAVACLFASLLFGAACGGNNSGGGQGSSGTPLGTYAIRITGSSASLQHTASTTLIVH